VARGEQTVPDWAIGCTDRAYISFEDGAKDPSIAIWIQTESQYFDLRIPHDRPALSRGHSLSELDSEALLALGRQSGDTGTCAIENDVATWTSWGDRYGFYCNDVASFPDDGRLDPKGGVIYEYDADKSPFRYEEAWVQQPYDHGLIAHLTLRDQREPDQPLGVLLVTGRYAGFVERSTTKNSATLETQLEAARGDLKRMREILDCEASYATRPRSGADYTIRHSNFPFREGRVLDVPSMNRRILERHEELPAARAGAVWRVESWFVAP
jgi:hypothetical protein